MSVKVQGLPGIIQSVASGGTHNCALVHNGGARCWGDNDKGQLGDGTTTNRSTPVTVTGLPLNLAQIAAADDHTCAVLVNTTVQCWGLNSKGQLGDGTTNDSSTPVKVPGLSGVVQIALGDGYTCALLASGDGQCWGWNIFGELGNGTTTDSKSPVQVSGLTSGGARHRRGRRHHVRGSDLHSGLLLGRTTTPASSATARSAARATPRSW